MARVSIFGMGYVGCVSAACLARDGHDVIGVDIAPVKLQAIREGRSPLGEPGLDDLVAAGVAAGRLRVTDSAAEAVCATDISLLCVGTPSRPNGSLDMGHLERVSEQIGAALRQRGPGHVVCVRSTMLPGSLDGIVKAALERASGFADGTHFHVASNPEFLREGSAIRDYDKPPKVVIGARSEHAANMLRALYAHIEAPVFVVRPEVAELVKCVDNTWHALKIAFANEVGEVCRQAGLDSHELIEIFLADRQLNVSPAYLRPGFAFGGSCLPKDVRAINYYARHHDLDVPILQHVLPSNVAMIERVFQRILQCGARKVGLYGLSFKPNTDDLRESPQVRLVEMLVGKGIEVRILDEYIQPDRLTGANKQYIDEHVPHMLGMLVDGFDALESFSEIIVVAHRTPAVEAWAARRNARVPVLDLARVPGLARTAGVSGASW